MTLYRNLAHTGRQAPVVIARVLLTPGTLAFLRLAR
jgi:hypothetical protein